jgi:hypothetical protein
MKDGPIRKYAQSCSVTIDPDTNKVKTYQDGKLVAVYKLVKKYAPHWSDETKSLNEIIVKILVKDWK